MAGEAVTHAKDFKMADKKAKKTSPAQFFQQVKAESKKITWPSRTETTASTIAVFIMVLIAAVFLYVADQVLALGVRTIMGF